MCVAGLIFNNLSTDLSTGSVKASCKLRTKRRSFEQGLDQGTLEGSLLGQLIVVSNLVSVPERSASPRAGGLEVAVNAALKERPGT